MLDLGGSSSESRETPLTLSKKDVDQGPLTNILNAPQDSRQNKIKNEIFNKCTRCSFSSI